VSYGSTFVVVSCCVLFFIREMIDVIIFTALFLLVNHSADPDLVGTANGICQSFASIARGLGPLLGGIMLTWSLSNGLSFPFDQYFVYFVLAFCLFIMLGISFLLDTTINHRKVAPEKSHENT